MEIKTSKIKWPTHNLNKEELKKKTKAELIQKIEVLYDYALNLERQIVLEYMTRRKMQDCEEYNNEHSC